MKGASTRKTRKKELERLYARTSAALKRTRGFGAAVPVFGEGPCPSPIMLVGEAPGREETKLGRPFVGKAGLFLADLLAEGLGLDRQELFITNAVKVWPHLKTGRLKTRPPTDKEAAYFLPLLLKEVELVAPRAVVAVGKTAFGSLCPGEKFVPGRWVESSLFKAPVMAVYHPAYIMRKQRSIKENSRAVIKALGEVRKAAAKAEKSV